MIISARPLLRGVLYSFVHLSVEVACFYFLFSRMAGTPSWWACAMLYNALAFLPQILIGELADRYRRIPYGGIGCVLMLAGLALPFDYPALFLLCIGNCLLHVDGALHTMHGAGGRVTPVAIFVGGGSFGVIAGRLLGSAGWGTVALLPVGLMLLSLGVCLFLYLRSDLADDGLPFTQVNTSLPVLPMLLILLLAVAARSFVSYAIPTEWMDTTLDSVLLFVFMGLGKMLGGPVADKFGFRTCAIVSLLVSIPFLAFGGRVMPLSIIGIALFSMTMPITVGILASRFRGRVGYSFGITTVGLFLGVLPSFFVLPRTLLSQIITLTVLCLAALGGILISIKKENKNA